MAYPPVQIPYDLILSGDVRMSGTGSVPSASITDGSVANLANISSAKLQSRIHAEYVQVAGSNVANATSPVFVAYKACSVAAITVMPILAPAGGNTAFSVQVMKSTNAGAFASILSGNTAYSVTNSSADRTAYALTLAGTPTLVANDALEVVIATSGNTGNQAQGVIVSLVINEDGA